MPQKKAKPAQPSGRIELENDRAAITALGERVVSLAKEAGYAEVSLFAVRLALEEAIVNAFKHGHRSLPGDEKVTVEYLVRPEAIELVVTDRGQGFEPEAVPDPTSEENLMKTSGRGLLLMRAYMSEITHNEAGNQIRMVYRRPDET